MLRRKLIPSLASSGLLWCIVTFVQCEPNGAVGQGADPKPREEEEADTLNDSILNGIQDPFLKETIKKLKAGEKVDFAATKPGTDFTLHTLAIEEPKHNLLLLRYLHQKGLSPEAVGKFGYSALTTAVKLGCEDIVQYLLSECKVDPDQLQAEERPFLNALQAKAVRIAQLLLDAGANPDLTTEKNQGARPSYGLEQVLNLKKAELAAFAEVVQQLLEKGNENVEQELQRDGVGAGGLINKIKQLYKSLPPAKKPAFKAAAQKRDIRLR